MARDHYDALCQGAAVIDRSDRGRIRLTGSDRRSYLQGLLTNDITALTPGTGCYAALLTPQGRMISDMRVIETGDEVMIDLPGSVASGVCDRLSQFVFSEDVEVADATASLSQPGLYGPQAANVLSAALGGDAAQTPQALDGMPVFANFRRQFLATTVLIVRSDDVGVRGFDFFVESPAQAPFRDALRAAGAIVVDEEAIEICRVEAGRPAFGIDMDAETIPLEAGIEDRAISLTKGCYVGQEIIIRVLHRGHGRVARRLVGLALDASAVVPARGDAVRAGERDVGSVTSAVHSPALGHPIALGYVHRDFAEAGTQVAVAGQPAVVTPLPFVSAA